MVENKIEKIGMIESMNIVICDDQHYFLEMMEKELRDYAAYRDLIIRIERFESSDRLINADLSGCDVLFLDIDMPGINGIDAARMLRENYPDLILVFVTGWIEYAPAGYRVNAFRYLLKSKLSEELAVCLDEVHEQLMKNAEMLSVNTRDRTIEVAIRNILFFEGTSQRAVLMHLNHPAKTVMCTGKLADYDLALAGKGFLRLQKSYLANLDNIMKIRNYTAVLRDGTELKVSEKRYSQIKKQFLMWKGKNI